jgi:cell wall assembly regulator SMI1
MDEISDSWARIQARIRREAPSLLLSFSPPASREQVAAAEATLGVELPTDLRSSILLHDGGPDLGGWQLFTLEETTRAWAALREALAEGTFPEGRDLAGEFVLADWWHPAFAAGDDSALCVDLAPGKKGTPGQVVEWFPDRPERPVRAGSFAAWLSDIADDLDFGRWVFSDDDGRYIPAG